MSILTPYPIRATLTEQPYVVIRADQFTIAPELATDYHALRAAYADLPADDYLPDGGKYRFRRFGRYRYQPDSGHLERLPHRDYFQDQLINPVTGGIVRKFAPLTDALFENRFLQAMIRFNLDHVPDTSLTAWEVDVHLIRVITKAGMAGEPTPEGIHQDGAEWVTVHLMALENAQGGDVTIYDDQKQPIETFRLLHVMDSYLFRDPIVWHGATPIQPIDPSRIGVRSILTFDYHALG
ncbi:MAG: 2OG-Fe dioxygenase family protein [Anaerolineae bacterium]|jgi:hypothetical protein|nr:2OG-Fe dioxygenase family protein [Anaerolineae bacterium]